MRLRIDLAYDGTDFFGWAIQPGLRTVQGDLESALALVLRQSAVTTVCAGRTDAGVHARAQVVHVDVDEADLLAAAPARSSSPCGALTRRLRGLLSSDVTVRSVAEAPDGFDARFSALWRRYVYRIRDDPSLIDPLTRGHVLNWPHRVDEGRMNEASAVLLGRHDFAAFCQRKEGATTIRRMLDIEWIREPNGLLVGTLRADAFCHRMVRSMVGCLVRVGEGYREPDWIARVLSEKVRGPEMLVVGAHGLTLEAVAYPNDDELAAQAAATRRVRSLE